MPRKTGEDQLLLVTVPWLQQRKHESSLAVPWWTDMHCAPPCTRNSSSPKKAGSVKLTNVLDVTEMATPVVDGSPSRTANLSPMLRWQRRARMRCHKFASGSPPDSTTSGRKLSLTTLQTMLSSVPSPAKPKQEHCLRQRGGSVSLCGKKRVTHGTGVHVGQGARRRERGANGTSVALFFYATTIFDVARCEDALLFLLTTHEVGAARAAQLDRTHDVRLLLGTEDTKADPKRVGREGRLSPRTDPSRKGAATLRMRLGSLHFDEQRK